MESQVQVFQNDQFGRLRTVMRNGEPWFVAVDVCKTLELGQVTNAIRRLDGDEKALISIKGMQRGNGHVNVVNEYGLYSLVFGSRKPEARLFKRWVTHEVLPAIRKTGGYIPVDSSMSDTEILARAVLVAQKTIEQKDALIAAQDERIKQDAPKVAFAERVASADRDIKVGDFAKLMSCDGHYIGRNTTFKLLRDHGFLDSWNKPFQKYMNMGIFSVHEILKGSKLCVVTYITPKGQMYLHERLFQDPSYLHTSCAC